jgi:hypothetical protein
MAAADAVPVEGGADLGAMEVQAAHETIELLQALPKPGP